MYFLKHLLVSPLTNYPNKPTDTPQNVHTRQHTSSKCQLFTIWAHAQTHLYTQYCNKPTTTTYHKICTPHNTLLFTNNLTDNKHTNTFWTLQQLEDHKTFVLPQNISLRKQVPQRTSHCFFSAHDALYYWHV